MITCNLRGRLGNQLFQYAATIAYSLRYNVPYFIPTKTARPQDWVAYKIGKVIYSDQLLPKDYYLWTPSSLGYEEIRQIDFSGIIQLDGLFQSYRYFDDYLPRIRELFDFPKESIDAVAIHVRRGDYLTLPNDYPVVTTEYIYKAIEVMRAAGKTKFIVFSDGMDWCKENINSTIPQCHGCTFEYSEGKDEIGDLTDMIRCKHQIISNSTYSYWGAILNRNENKIVVCPHEDNFHGKDKKFIDVSDLYPKDWVRIKY